MNMKMPGFSLGKTEECLHYGLVKYRAWRYKLVYNHKPRTNSPSGHKFEALLSISLASCSSLDKCLFLLGSEFPKFGPMITQSHCLCSCESESKTRSGGWRSCSPIASGK